MFIALLIYHNRAHSPDIVPRQKCGVQPDPRGRTGGPGSCFCQMFELGPTPMVSSRLVKNCYQNRDLEAAREAGEETFRKEINKRGDRLPTLAKGALIDL